MWPKMSLPERPHPNLFAEPSLHIRPHTAMETILPRQTTPGQTFETGFRPGVTVEQPYTARTSPFATSQDAIVVAP